MTTLEPKLFKPEEIGDFEIRMIQKNGNAKILFDGCSKEIGLDYLLQAVASLQKEFPISKQLYIRMVTETLGFYLGLSIPTMLSDTEDPTNH